MTPEEYLAFERKAEGKHEYFEGEVIAMTGASKNHNQIVFNLNGLLWTELRRSTCRGFAGDMRVRIPGRARYFYPDLVITCEEPRFEDREVDTLLNPQVVIEILSPSTETYVRGKKFAAYRRLESLREYVLVSQTAPQIEHFARVEHGWLMTVVQGLDGELLLPTAGCRLPLTDIYERVEFEDPDGPTGGCDAVAETADSGSAPQR